MFLKNKDSEGNGGDKSCVKKKWDIEEEKKH